jgi:tellurite resistance protein TerC
VFGVVVVVVLAIDLGAAARKPLDVDKGLPKRKALAWLAVWVACGCAFGAWVLLQDRETGLQWFSAYVIEYSLSVDNLFVFLLLFHAFRVPRGYQHRVLFYGILGAVVLRGVFILGGTALLSTVHAFIAVFGAFLVYTAAKLIFGGDDDEGDVADNRVVKLAKRFVRVTDSYDRDRFFSVVDGVRKATPLLLVAVCVEISDVLFAFDSVPAAFGISLDPFVVYTSNIFAILGLRSIFFLLSGALWGLRFLKPALGIVLGFIGLKMCLGAAHWVLAKVDVDAAWLPERIPTPISLGVVAFFLGAGIALSLLFPGKKEDQVAAAEEIKEDIREIVHPDKDT